MSSTGGAATGEAGRGWNQDDLAQRVRFGAGTLDELPATLRELGIRRPLVVTSAGRASSADGERLARILGRAVAGTFAEVEPHLPATTVRDAFQALGSTGADGVVSLGGGSVVDCGKAVAFFVEQQGGIPGRGLLDRPALVHVAVPTTYTPAVLSRSFTMTDPHTRTKAAAGSTTSAPVAAFYDPEALADLGPVTTAGTAFDALAAAIGGTTAPGRSPETETLGYAACQRIAGILPLVVDTPDDALVRADLLEGSVLAARVLQRTGPGLHEAVTQLLGGRTGAPHGVVSAILLPHTVRWEAGVDPAGASRLAELMSGDQVDVLLAELLERVGLPARLGDIGIDADDLDAVARLSQAHPGTRRSHVPAAEADVRAVLAAAA